MKRSVQIYIEGERIELFNDEEIQVNSSVQNVNDIDKVKTDFSQSFTIPASPINNAIFQHFYQNDVNATLNYNIKRDAYIEIDTVLFRKGKIQLEKSDIKNLATDSYTITFYGEVTGLKDQFGEDKLSMLDYSSYSHVYSATAVLDRLSADLVTDFDVRYPLITSRRVWQYNEPSTPLDNIDTNTGRIEYSELFPALKVARIFDAIESTYGVTFQGSWLQSDKFQKLFLYLKTTEQFNYVTPSQRVDILTNINTVSLELDATDDVVRYIYDVQAGGLGGDFHEIYFRVLSASNNSTYYIDVYKNGALINTITGSGVNDYYVGTQSNSQILDEYYFEVRANNTITLGVDFYDIYFYNIEDPSTGQLIQQVQITVATCGSITLTGLLNLSVLMPDIKVADFVAGIMREFNLTLYPVSDNIYYLEPLEDWYARGVTYNITPFVDTDSIEIKRVPLFKKIDFKYQKSESFMNNAFFDFFNRAYADLSSTFNFDGSDYTIQVPFEAPLFNKFTSTEIQVGYSLKNSPEYQPYIPKPILLYFNGMENINSAPFKFGDGVSIITIFNYALFGQDLEDVNGNIFSLCWGQEVSSFYQQTVDNSLYTTYYQAYLQNLYNPKQRLVSVKTVLPIRLLSQLRLMDRLIIRDKRYVINDMKSNLVNGEVMLTLLHDFRPLKRRKRVKPLAGVNQVVVGINKMVDSVQGDIDISGTDIISVTPATFTEDTLVTFELPPFTGELINITAEDGTFISSEDGEDTLGNEESYSNVYDIPVTYTFTDGSTDTEYILISRS
jgi:hypothetical protein